MADFLQTLLMAITIGSLYALIALGYTMVYGILKLINFAHSDVVVLGAWSSLALAIYLVPRLGVDLSTTPPWWVPAVVLVGAMLVCAIVAFCIERFAYRPLRKAPRLNALITAIGVSLLLQNTGQLQYTFISDRLNVASGNVIERGTDPRTIKLDQPLTIRPDAHYALRIIPGAADQKPVERRVTSEPGEYAAGALIHVDEPIGRAATRDATFELVQPRVPLRLPFGPAPGKMPALVEADEPAMLVNFTSELARPDGSVVEIAKPLRITWVQIVTIATAFSLMVGLQVLVYHTRLGMAMRAVSFNNDYAALMGIPVDRVISITFVLGAVLAAAAGFLYGQQYIGLQQTAHFTWVLMGLKAFVAAVVGGIGNLRGAVVGGFLIAFIEQFGGFYGTVVFDNASAFTDVAVFLLLILVLIVKPSGLFGSTAQEKV